MNTVPNPSAPAARPPDGSGSGPVVGLFGAFDTGELGEVALRRVMEAELRRRRPDIDLVAFAPFGAERPVPGDEGRGARPLPSGGAVGGGLGVDALIVTGDVLAGDAGWAARYPVDVTRIAERCVGALVVPGPAGGEPFAGDEVWFAVGAPIPQAALDLGPLGSRQVWARDSDAQGRIGGAAVRCGDPVLLAGRAFTPETVRRRSDLLRMCGALPTGRRLVVEVSRDLDPAGESIAEALSDALRSDPRLSVVVAGLDATRLHLESALDVSGLVAERVHHLPAWAGLDDIAAAMSGAAAVIATSPAGAHLAAALGAPVVALTAATRDRFDPAIPIVAGELRARIAALLDGGTPPVIDDAVRVLDEALNALAERLPGAPGHARPVLADDPEAPALASLQQRLADERTALAAELSRVQAELDHLRASPEHRLARPVRDAYQRWQRRRT